MPDQLLLNRILKRPRPGKLIHCRSFCCVEWNRQLSLFSLSIRTSRCGRSLCRLFVERTSGSNQAISQLLQELKHPLPSFFAVAHGIAITIPQNRRDHSVRYVARTGDILLRYASACFRFRGVSSYHLIHRRIIMNTIIQNVKFNLILIPADLPVRSQPRPSSSTRIQGKSKGNRGLRPTTY